MAVRSRSVLKWSVWKMLFLPTVASNRLRGAMRGGFLSSFSVPGAGIDISEDENCEGAQDWKPAASVALTPCAPNSN